MLKGGVEGFTMIDVLQAMKGPGKKLMSIIRGKDQFDLMGYQDGSFGISRNSDSLATWEADGREECLSALMRITGWRDTNKSILILRLGAKKGEGAETYAARLN